MKRAALLIASFLVVSAPLSAETGSAGNTIIAYANLDMAGADGERSWLDGGFGKGRIGGASDGGWRIQPYFASGGLVVQPHLGWGVTATVSGIAQRGQQHAFDLSEAFLTWRPMPLAGVRASVRAGYFWPSVSLEHGGAEWAVRDTITPSAINSWIGEEVKVAGIEANASTMLGGSRIAATGAVFALNQTAGTLLAFRGWALHDEQATGFGLQRLPTLNGFFQIAQAPETRPAIQLDDRLGWYAKVSFAPPGPFEIQYFHYDNRGDPQAFTPTLQWGWRTRFDHVGMILDVDAKTRLSAQALTGTTVMGFPSSGVPWVDTRYRAAYLLATRRIGRASVSGRIDWFDTRNRGSKLTAEDDEYGHAFDVAAKLPLSPIATLMLEELYIDSERDARQRLGIDPEQRQNVVRLSLRLRASR